MLQRVASRRSAIRRIHGSIAPLLEAIPHEQIDSNTPKVLHAVFDPLGEEAVRLAAREVLEAAPRLRGNAAAYAVEIGKRIGRDHFFSAEKLAAELADVRADPGVERDVGSLGYS